jgi:NitT/TauT family transport system ATP-binding protein
MLFQRDGLFPWLTAEENVEFPLRVREIEKAERRVRAAAICEAVRLPSPLRGRLPSELSGGERRRVELAMALAAESQLFLLDEPTTGFDFRLKAEIQELLYSTWLREGAAYVTVTHDINEAVYLGDRVLCLKDGKIVGEDSVPFPHPRGASIRQDPRFLACVESVEHHF